MEPLALEGVFAASSPLHSDGRGSFREWFRAADFRKAAGYDFRLAQANCSISRRGAVRGIHFADVPPGQAKFVACASGQIMDVVVDVRVGSPTFGRWIAEQLDANIGRALFIPEGFGHAWTAMSETAALIYLCSQPYDPSRERAIYPLDAQIGIPWPLGEKTLSTKDDLALDLAEAQKKRMLPSYDVCMKYQAGLRG